jgi:hypothetical protein
VAKRKERREMRSKPLSDQRSSTVCILLKSLVVIMLLAFLVVSNSVADEIEVKATENCRKKRPCERTCLYMLKSSLKEAASDYWLALANAINLTDDEERAEAKEEASEELEENIELAFEQYEARLEVCELLDEDRYDPEIDPENFVDYVDNEYFPLVPGTTFVYEAETEDGTEHIEVAVTHETKDILGVECIVVRATEELDGEVVEDTFDWYVQDVAGNVWYFGELSREYEDGELVSLEGSWKAGEDGAKPGIIMMAVPEVGKYCRQEFALGEAEDLGGVLSLTETAIVPYDSFTNCLMTEDFTPIEPGIVENKYYAPGVGLVLEVDFETGERVELIDITTE